jgi:hypothetical protein
MDIIPHHPDTGEPLQAGAKFPLGQVIITPNAATWVPAEVIARSLARHQSGNWGDVSEAFAGEMDEALRNGWPVVSLYFLRGPFHQIVTYPGRALTRVTVPRDSFS